MSLNRREIAQKIIEKEDISMVYDGTVYTPDKLTSIIEGFAWQKDGMWYGYDIKSRMLYIFCLKNVVIKVRKVWKRRKFSDNAGDYVIIEEEFDKELWR